MPFPSPPKRRRCQAKCLDGLRCHAWSVVGQAVCNRHGGRPPGPPRPRVCRCPAYAFAHRPAKGLCKWPDPPPVRSTTPAGKHRQRQMAGFYKRMGIYSISGMSRALGF